MRCFPYSGRGNSVPGCCVGQDKLCLSLSVSFKYLVLAVQAGCGGAVAYFFSKWHRLFDRVYPKLHQYLCLQSVIKIFAFSTFHFIAQEPCEHNYDIVCLCLLPNYQWKLGILNPASCPALLFCPSTFPAVPFISTNKAPQEQNTFSIRSERSAVDFKE